MHAMQPRESGKLRTHKALRKIPRMVTQEMDGNTKYAEAIDYLYREADGYTDEEEFAAGIRYAADILKEFGDDESYRDTDTAAELE